MLGGRAALLWRHRQRRLRHTDDGGCLTGGRASGLRRLLFCGGRAAKRARAICFLEDLFCSQRPLVPVACKC